MSLPLNLNNSTLKKISEASFGSAVDGAFYSPGAELTEGTLGDSNEVTQKAISQIGLSKLLDPSKGPLYGQTKGFTKNAVANQFEDESLSGAHLLSDLDPEISAGISLQNKLGAHGVLKPIEDLKRRADKQLASGIKDIFNFSPGDVKEIEPVDAEEKRLAFYELQEKLNKLKTDPSHAIDLLSGNTEYLSEHAPQIAKSTMNTTVGAIQYLISQLPAEEQNPALLQRVGIADSDIDKFNKNVAILEDPMSVLKQIKAGAVSKEAIMAIQTVMPQLYKEMTTNLLMSVADKGREIPYQTRLGISKFIGNDLDGSNNPVKLMSNQTVFNGPSQQMDRQGQGVRKSQGGQGPITLGQRSKTDLRQSLERSK